MKWTEAIEELNASGRIAALEVNQWTPQVYKGRPRFFVWDDGLHRHFEGDSLGKVMQAWREAVELNDDVGLDEVFEDIEKGNKE